MKWIGLIMFLYRAILWCLSIHVHFVHFFVLLLSLLFLLLFSFSPYDCPSIKWQPATPRARSPRTAHEEDQLPTQLLFHPSMEVQVNSAVLIEIVATGAPISDYQCWQNLWQARLIYFGARSRTHVHSSLRLRRCSRCARWSRRSTRQWRQERRQCSSTASLTLRSVTSRGG